MMMAIRTRALAARATRGPRRVWTGPPLPPLPSTSFFTSLRTHGAWDHAADSPAISCYTSGRTLTYGDLDRRVASAAQQLASSGFGRGSVLNIHLPNCEQTIVAFLAATELGGVVMPSNPIYNASELAGLQADSGTSITLSTVELRETVDAACATSGVRAIHYIEDADCFANALLPDAQLPGVEPPVDAHEYSPLASRAQVATAHPSELSAVGPPFVRPGIDTDANSTPCPPV